MGILHIKLRGIIIQAIILSFILSTVSIINVEAVGNDKSSSIDLVLVLDSSKSMLKSDSQKIRIEAMKMFIDMFHIQGDKIGFDAYSDKIVKDMKMKAINSIEDKNQLKASLGDINLGSWTDIGLGLKKGVELLEAGHVNGHNPIIVLLSDGKNDPSRSKQLSENDLAAAIKTAKEKNYPIYTIGLDADGTVDKNSLIKIASETGGKNFITNAAKDLPNIIREIYADNSKSNIVAAGDLNGNGDFQEVYVSIPNSHVTEANITLLSQNHLNVRLFNPRGQEVKLPSSSAVYTSSQKYSVVKLFVPEKGKWKLQVRGIKGDKIDVSSIFNYDLQVKINLEPKSNYIENSIVKIEAYLTSNEKRINDIDLYNSLKGKLIIKNLSDNKLETFELNNNRDSFSYEYKLKEKGDCELRIRLDGQSFYRESDLINIVVKEAAPIQKVQISERTNNKNEAAVKDKIKENTNSSMNSKIIIAAIIMLVMVVIIVIVILSLRRNKKGSFVGELMLLVNSETPGKSKAPKYIKLKDYKREITIKQLVKSDPDLFEAFKISIMPGFTNSIIINNKSLCKLEKFGTSADASKILEMKNYDRITIVLNKKPMSINLEYNYFE